MEHDGRDTVSETSRVSQSVLVKLHYHPLRFCAACLSSICLCADGNTFVPQIGGGVGDGNENDRGH